MTIQLKNLRKIYKMGAERVHALDGVDLNIQQNEYVAIMGASGSGKSTLMNILGCLDSATDGQYLLDNHDVTRLSSGALARVRNEQIGFVFQSFELMPRLTAVQNVELPLIYGRNALFGNRERAKEALVRVGLGDRLTHRPNQLSGGQQQRIAVARALVNKPAILLADEPTGNLDSHTTLEILQLLDQLHKEGQTVVIVTHEEDVARRAQRTIRMLDGKIVSDSPNSSERESAP